MNVTLGAHLISLLVKMTNMENLILHCFFPYVCLEFSPSVLLSDYFLQY